jgi:hypothetical protein
MTHKLVYEDFAPYFKVDGGNLIRIDGTTKTKPNSVVGYFDDEGYIKTKFKKKIYFVHRIIYLLTHKECPDVIDHINGIKNDNRPENLRASTVATNCQNRFDTHSNCGVKGVHKLKNGTGYQVYINLDGKRKRLGTYQDIELAELVAFEARSKYHGAFANNGVKS